MRQQREQRRLRKVLEALARELAENGIENAFNREYKKREPKADIYGEGGFASLGEILAGQKRGAAGNAAQKQTFD